MNRIYLDHAATTRLDPRVFEVMVPYLKEHYGNASSVHTLGRKARFAVEESREKIASHLGAEPAEILFTSGGTEADNTALRGVVQGTARTLVTASMEHEAIVRTAEALEAQGHRVLTLTPQGDGAVTPDQLAEVLTNDVGLVSLMLVNNEIGSITPVRALADLCHERDIPFHTDAVQAAGLFELQVDTLGVDLLTLSGHKIYGPKGVGVLYVRAGLDINPHQVGGSQERGRRGGTENVAAIVGMAKALELAEAEAEERVRHVTALRDRLQKRLTEALGPCFVFNTPFDAAIGVAPHIVNIAFPPQEGQAMLTI